MQLMKHKVVNADGAHITTVITNDSPDMLDKASAKIKHMFPQGYPFLKIESSIPYTDMTRGQWND